MNGFAEVVWQGTSSWAHGDYLVAPVAAGDVIGTWRTSVDLNLRSGPSTSNEVRQVMPSGSWVEVPDTVIDRFRFISFNGLPG